MIEHQIESVTPKKAELWLNGNNSNRKMRDGVAERYADDMKNGRWTQCTAPICFYGDGEIADGQHRLWAIIESGAAQKFIVVRGLTREDGLNIDTGLGRSLVDAGRISGLDKDLSNALIAVARAVDAGEPPNAKQSNAQRLELVDLHREAAKWAVTYGPKSKFVGSAVVKAAIARAWYTEQNRDKLRRFCDVVGTGFSAGDEESAAVAIRNYLINKGNVAATGALWRDTFLKVQNAIAYFMEGKKLTVIRGVSEEAYPLNKKPKRNINARRTDK